MGKPGSVSFGFDEVSLVIVPAEGLDEEKAMEIALEAGAEDVQSSEGVSKSPAPAACYAIRDAFVDAEVEPSSFERTMIPQNEVACDSTPPKKSFDFSMRWMNTTMFRRSTTTEIFPPKPLKPKPWLA